MRIPMQALPRELKQKVRLQAEMLRQESPSQGLETAFEVMDEVARYREGSGTSRLAQIALKVNDDGDSTLGEMGASSILSQLKQIPGAGAQMGSALSMLLGPVSSVLAATFDSLAEVKEGDNFIKTVARTGVKAIEAEQDSGNPIGSGLAAEPFVLGISEHEYFEPNAAKACDALQENVPALFAQPAREAYRATLTGIAGQKTRSSESLIAEAGLALYNALPDKKNDVAPLALGLMEELSYSDNPFTEAVAGEAHSLAESLSKEEESKDKAGPVIEAVMETIAGPEGAPRTIESASKLGQSWFSKLGKLDISLDEKRDLANEYFETISEETGSPVLGFAAEWAASIDEDKFDVQMAVMSQALESVSENPRLGPEGLFQVADQVAKDNPENRHAALGSFLAIMSEEVGQPELAEFAEQDFSPQNLAKMEKSLSDLSEQFGG